VSDALDAAGDLRDRIRDLVAVEDAPTVRARERAEQVGPVPSAEVGAVLAWAAATTLARHVVEVGSTGGLSGLWLLRGMQDRGVLTSVEHDSHWHGLATTAYEQAGVSDRVRSILGDPTEVLPRLSDETYELMLVQGRLTDHPTYLEHARRLLKPGGVLVARGLMHHPDTARGTALRAFAELLEEDGWIGSVLPVDDGLGLATRMTAGPAGGAEIRST
jgi:predicted O-methyltransferase YrrM